MAVATRGSVRRGSTCAVMARVLDADAALISKANLATVTYSIWLLDDRDPNSRTAVAAHADVSLDINTCISDTPQTTKGWSEDATGWNFRHVIDVSSDPAFATAGRRYLVEVKLTPTAGQLILVPFLINVL